MDNNKGYFNTFNVLVAIFAFLFCLFLIYWLPGWLFSQIPFNQYVERNGQIGDSIGGTIGPVIALIAAFLTFFAFKVQYDANQQQKMDLAKERFENKFFEMLSLHKENVNEMSIEGYDAHIINKTIFNKGTSNETIEHSQERITKIISSRKIFVTTFNEFASCFRICQNTITQNFKGKENYIIKLSYALFYYGIGSGIVKNIDKEIEHDEIYIKKCKENLQAARTQHEDSFSKENIFKMPNQKDVGMYFKHKPFSGHSSRFGHYYRHLFLLTRYVVNQPSKLLSPEQKYEYIDLIRAQLSMQEQLMLYINYLSGEGMMWENDINAFFSDYRLIHNLPYVLAKKVKDPRVQFKNQIKKIRTTGKEMFDFDEFGRLK